MKTKIKLMKAHQARFFKNVAKKSTFLCLILLVAISGPLQGQTEAEYTAPSWWFGAAAGANFNFYRGSTQQLDAAFKPLVTFHDGFGVGLYLSPTIEYYRPNSMWGMMFQFGYDSRQGTFTEAFSPCNCPADLSTSLSYLTIEPSLRFAPFKSSFYLYAGPRVALNLNQSYTYQLKANPAFSDQVDGPIIEGEFSEVNNIIISGQIGARYDIPLSSANKKTQFVLSPFISFQPYFGQNPRAIETWNITTLRAGATLKFGRGRKVSQPEEKIAKQEKAIVVPVAKVGFTVNAPKNIPQKRRVKETFPVLNYVFFDVGSTEIPKRYVSLNQSEVAGFKEEKVDLFTPKDLSGRSERQMIVYYNVLNILGDRMVKNPTTKVTLVGSSEKGPEDARMMAESVKTYLVSVFAIDAARIVTEGRDSPKITSNNTDGATRLVLLREDNRRVSIQSSSPKLMMEFQSGPDAQPAEATAVQQAPVESYVTFNNDGAKKAFTSWSLKIKDDKGQVKTFGPFTEDVAVIPGKDIMGSTPEGTYQVQMIGRTKDNKTVEKEAEVKMVLWTPSETAVAMRFSVPFAFNESSTTPMYVKYLREVVAPKVPKNGKIVIHGYADMIGDAGHNKSLSQARANDVKGILETALSKAGRSDASFEVHGVGEDPELSQFGNKYAEERFYNRSVVIDLLP